MTQVQGGRVCSECNKKVTDMSRMRWKQIEQLHTEQPGICGMYTPKQVQHWGHEVPSTAICSKAFAVTSMMLTLAGVPFVSQSQSVNEVEIKFNCEPVDSTKALPTESQKLESKTTFKQTSDSSDCTIVKGFILNDDGLSLPFAAVVFLLNGSQIAGGYTDENGFFEVDLTGRVTETSSFTMKTSYVGFMPVEINFDGTSYQKTNEVNLKMNRIVNGMMTVGLIIDNRTPIQKAGQKVFNMLRRFKY